LLLEAGIDSGSTTPGSVELSIIGGNAMVLTGRSSSVKGLSIWWHPVHQSNTIKITEIFKNQLSTNDTTWKSTHGYRRLAKG
jgi:hypothetical protein